MQLLIYNLHENQAAFKFDTGKDVNGNEQLYMNRLILYQLYSINGNLIDLNKKIDNLPNNN